MTLSSHDSCVFQGDVMRMWCEQCQLQLFAKTLTYSLTSPAAAASTVCVCVCACARACSCLVKSDSSRPHGLQPDRLLCPRDSPGKNTGVGCHFLLQGVFLTHGLNLCPLHWQAGSLPLSQRGSLLCEHTINIFQGFYPQQTLVMI